MSSLCCFCLLRKSVLFVPLRSSVLKRRVEAFFSLLFFHFFFFLFIHDLERRSRERSFSAHYSRTFDSFGTTTTTTTLSSPSPSPPLLLLLLLLLHRHGFFRNQREQEEEENQRPRRRREEEREAVFAVGKDDARAKEERKKEEEKIIPAMRNTFEVGTGRQRKVRVDIAPRYSLQGVCYFLLGGIVASKLTSSNPPLTIIQVPSFLPTEQEKIDDKKRFECIETIGGETAQGNGTTYGERRWGQRRTKPDKMHLKE